MIERAAGETPEDCAPVSSDGSGINEEYMRAALAEAAKAAREGETPVGAVITLGGKIIAKGHNQRERKRNALLHAEIIAIRRACKKLKSWRLCGCEMYVTLEPCPMCAGALAQARIEKVYYAAADPKGGACGSIMDVLANPKLNHRVECVGGLLAGEAAHLLREFFARLRKSGKKDGNR